MNRLTSLVVPAVLLASASAQGALIQVTPSDNWTKIEAAKAGDVVEIAPGTYRFRVVLSQTGTAAKPIIIRAKDPARRPVWDLDGKAVSAWPGSYSAGDKGRGCWQVQGAHYIISGIVFQHCQDASSAGLRAVNCGPLTIRDCLFVGNTNGLTGSSENLVVEFSEFYDNGKLVSLGDMTHNIYVYGGVLTLRYSYVHDSHEGQNFHIRARESLLEYNWLARADGYSGDVMSCNTLCGSTGTSPITQTMLLRGNVLIQGSPKNMSQIIALYNDESDGSYDESGSSAAMELTLIGNTIIGNQTNPSHRLVNLRNDSGVSTTLHLSNNIVMKVGTLYEAADPSLSNWSVDGQANWVTSGTGGLGKVTGTVSGNDPGFVNAAAKDFTLGAASPCLGKTAALTNAPDREYYRDEMVKLQYRSRPSAKDIGAFERGNASPPIGANGSPLQTDAGLLSDAGALDSYQGNDGIAAPTDGSSADGGAASEGDGAASEGGAGCSCRLVSNGDAGTGGMLLLLLLLGPSVLLGRHRRRCLTSKLGDDRQSWPRI